MVKSCKNCRTAKKEDFVPCASCDPTKTVEPLKKITTCSKCRTAKKADFKQCNKCFVKDQEEVSDKLFCLIGCQDVKKLYKSVNKKGVVLILCDECVIKINNITPQEFKADLDTSEIHSYFASVEDQE